MMRILLLYFGDFQATLILQTTDYSWFILILTLARICNIWDKSQCIEFFVDTTLYNSKWLVFLGKFDPFVNRLSFNRLFIYDGRQFAIIQLFNGGLKDLINELLVNCRCHFLNRGLGFKFRHILVRDQVAIVICLFMVFLILILGPGNLVVCELLALVRRLPHHYTSLLWPSNIFTNDIEFILLAKIWVLRTQISLRQQRLYVRGFIRNCRHI